MSTATYMLPTQPLTLSHGLGVPSWLADFDDSNAGPSGQGFTVADAMAASGDYFITLATSLDKVAQSLPLDSSQQIELEHQVKTLFYMQEHYDLVAKYKRR